MSSRTSVVFRKEQHIFQHIDQEELRAYLDEQLSPARAGEIEERLRSDAELRTQLSLILQLRDQGSHTLGEIWRRHRVSCPSRAELGEYIWGAGKPSQLEYIRFHLHEVECRYCLANLADLENSQSGEAETRDARQIRYFESSAGFLKSPE